LRPHHSRGFSWRLATPFSPKGKVASADATKTNEEKGGTMTTTKTLTKEDLAQFMGSENWYRHGLVRDVLYTDGAKYLADAGGAYWLLDEIALAQRYDKRVAGEEFQVWKLMVKEDHSATLACDDGNGNIVYTKRIPFTDFPLEEISLYFCNNTILLPSEY
jgi:hypothetical protein